MAHDTSTPYDDVFRTLLNDCPDLIIPVLNDTFGTTFVMGQDEVTQNNNEFFFTRADGSQDDRTSDSHIVIGGKRFHIECQSTQDGSMVVRMFEYDVQIAMQHAEREVDQYTVEFPQSAVLYLRSTKHTPDYMRIVICVPGDSCEYAIPVIKAKNFTVEEIFDKELYFLIPFHIFCYEARFCEYEVDETKLKEAEHIFEGIREQLERVCQDGRISEYYHQTILTMSEKVIRHIAAKFAKTSERIGEIMGGKILDYPAKDILNEGRKEGRKEGFQAGRVQVYQNMLKRGFSQQEALAIADLTLDEVNDVLKNRD